MEKVAAQDEASVRAINGEFKDSDTYLHIYSPDPHQNLDLVISHRERSLPQLIPGISQLSGSEMKTDVSGIDRKSTRLNSSHRCISYAVFCLKKKNRKIDMNQDQWVRRGVGERVS